MPSLYNHQPEHSAENRSRNTVLTGMEVADDHRYQADTTSQETGWINKFQSLFHSGMFGPFVGIMIVLALLGINNFLAFEIGIEPNWMKPMNLGLIAIGILLLIVLFHRLNKLSDKILKLSRDMDEEVRKQTERIAQKNHALEVLYDVAASINISSNLEDLLKRFLRTLKDVLKAKTATVRLINYDGQMRLIDSIGLDKHRTETEILLPVLHCMHGKELHESGFQPEESNILKCEKYPGQPYYNDDNIEMIAVPLQYRGKNLGVYNVFIEKPGLVDREEIKELLISIGRHLGVAIEKAHIDDESKRLSIIKERNLLSHELHDSLAQTLASLRFQVRMLDETLQSTGENSALQEVTLIKNGIEEAHTELRELLAHFRAPFDERGLISAVENVVERFRKETDITIFLQNEWKIKQLPSVLEMQILRIIQESLANIRKHSQAHTVRVLLRSNSNGECMILIEDDGIGIQEPIDNNNPGEHIGLSIMQERAHRLGGTIKIESEPDEGTQVMLQFQINRDEQQELLDIL